MSHTAAISNPYAMAQGSKERTPIDIHVNGKRGWCPNHGTVQVKVITSLMLGRRRDPETKEETPRSILVCARCNSVIQVPAPEQPKPKKVQVAEGKANPKIYVLLDHLINGERDGRKLARLLGVSQPTMWIYLWELQRNGLVLINKEGRNASLKMVSVTAEGYHHFDMEKP